MTKGWERDKKVGECAITEKKGKEAGWRSKIRGGCSWH